MFTGKLPGRIGDTPILGAGTYADNVIFYQNNCHDFPIKILVFCLLIRI